MRELQSSKFKWAPSSIPVMSLLIDPSLVIYVALMRAEYEGRVCGWWCQARVFDHLYLVPEETTGVKQTLEQH